MKKQTIFTIFAVVLLGLAFSIYQYSETFKTEVASATSTVPNPGHLWSSTECNSDSLCVDTVNNRLGIGTASPGVKLEVNGGTTGSVTIAKLFNDVDATGESVELLIGKAIGAGQSGRISYIYDSVTADNRYLGLGTEGGGTPLVVTYGGNVGIGTTTPGAKLDIKGSTETWEGMSKLFLTDSNTTANSRNWMIGNGGADYGSLVFRVSTAKDGNPATAGIFGLVIDRDGKVGIGTGSPNYNLTVAGTAWVTSGSWSGSDARWKKNVLTLSTASSLDKILALNPVAYEWKIDEYPEMNFSNGTQLGFIAQDVENIIPEVVTTDNNGYKGISYEKIVPVLTSAIQEQQREIEQLKTMVCLDHPLAEICK